MGTKSFIRELKKNKIRVTTDGEDEEISCVLISYDNQLTYEKISDTCRLLSTKKVDYLATNPDYVCPIEFGYVPDCGAICEMLNHAIKRMPHFIGKPEPDIYLYACSQIGEQPEDCIAVEDSPNGIKSAYAAGCKPVMVPDLTQPDEEIKPLLYAVVDSLADLKGLV